MFGQTQKDDPVAQMEAASRLGSKSVTLIVILFIAFTAGFAVLFWKKDEVKEFVADKRSTRLINQAREANAEGKLEQAQRLLVNAYRIHPDNPEILRELIRLDPDPDSKTNTAWLYYLHQRKQTTVNEHIELLERLLDLGQFKDNRTIAESLSTRAPNNPRALRAIARATEFRDTNEHDQLVDLLQNASDLDPSDRRIQFERARTKLTSPLSDVEEVGVETILKLAENDQDIVSLDALRFIAVNRRKFSPAIYPKFFSLYQNHPLRTEQDEPIAFAWELEIYPERAEVLVPKVLEQWNESLTPDELADRLYWLTTNKQAQHIIDFLEKTDNSSSPVFATAKTSADLALNPNLSKTEISDILRKTADLATTSGRSADLLRLGEIALNYQLDDDAQYIFEGALNIAPQAAHYALANLARRTGTPDQLLNHLEALLELSESDPNLIGETTYLRILLRKNLDRATLHAQGLVNRYPENAQAQLLSAFALIRQKRTIDAGIIINALDAEKIEPRLFPALAAVYEALGRTNDADRIAQRIDVATLSLPEISLIQPITSRLEKK
ncbi:MAG: hypothetical protein AAF591_16330 [Verrucomicrobiota bacterium]